MKNKGSSTAKLVALVNYIYLKSNPDESQDYTNFVVACFKRVHLFEFVNIIFKIDFGSLFYLIERKFLKGFVKHIGSRKRIIRLESEQLINKGLRQFVVLGAGWDVLGAYLAKRYPEVRVFEVDHPLTQNARPFHGENLNRIVIPCQFEKESFIDKLLDSKWDPGLTTLFIWEGVTMYLDERDVKSTFKQIASRAKSAHVIFTFMHKRDDGKIQFLNAPGFTDQFLKYKQEPFNWGIERSKIKDFLEEFSCKKITLIGETENPSLLPLSETLAIAEFGS